jgi:hypothetical protein
MRLDTTGMAVTALLKKIDTTPNKQQNICGSDEIAWDRIQAKMMTRRDLVAASAKLNYQTITQ